MEKLLSETEAVLGPDGKVVENGVGTSHPKPPEGGKKKDAAGSNQKKDSSVVIAPESAVELYCNLCKSIEARQRNLSGTELVEAV